MALEDKKPVNQTMALVGLLLNILILPGLGSMVAGRMKTGLWQIILTVVSAILVIVLIGILGLIAAWIWGLVTGIQMIQEAPK